MRRLVSGLVMTMALAAMVSCGSGSEASTEGEEEAPVSIPEVLQPAGSDLADGLVVPKGTRLAGAVFAQPSEVDGVDDWTAHLVIDGDPFAAWDDLAAQFRDGGLGALIAGSADACVWTIADRAEVETEGGTGEPAGTVPAGGAAATGAEATGSASTTTSVPGVDPYLAAVTISADAPRDDVDGVECNAAAPSTGDGSARSYSVRLQTGAGWPATMTIESSVGAAGMTDQLVPTAWRTSLERQSLPGGGPAPIPGPEPVPAEAAQHVPPAVEQDAPEPGEPFGQEVNCFVDAGYEQLRLPQGTSFVAGSFRSGSDSVLAVDDVAAAIADIQQQTAGDGTSEDGSGTIEQLHPAGGGEVTTFAFAISGGGGACGAASSADGRFLVVSVHGD